ncbi:MAG TPA: NAD-dependent epimerase/dehydratase family protein [Bryobacteraceae bacterium]|nr:NAD-dependent epimerase/dehydratase family protein [Bryobacteraceae bacterium]
MDHILITGGAGFLGSHLADRLLELGHRVRALDNLSTQVHGPSRARPSYLSSDVELMIGDVCDPAAVQRALKGVDAVVHFASIVGVGQSMYDLCRYTHVNTFGTAVLLEAFIRNPVRRLVVASSMSIYGEGIYQEPGGSLHCHVNRSIDQLHRSEWEPRLPDGTELISLPTPEWKSPSLASLYALSKYDQEQMCLMIGKAYGIPSVALRFFNVYGPNQALSNPYTGVLAIFASRLLNNQRPIVFEDGEQKRDVVSVYDVARACCLAIYSDKAAGHAINIGSGKQHTIRELASRMGRVLGKNIEPDICGQYRVGDIRHCFPDINLARKVLGFEPEIVLEDGLVDLAAWLETQNATDHFVQAKQELESRGLVV